MKIILDGMGGDNAPAEIVKGAIEAALEAAHLRFRPIIMTSFAFILGVVPLYTASGASSASQRAIGTTVFWGMLIGTILSVFLVPLFYTMVRKVFKSAKHQNQNLATQTAETDVSTELAGDYIEETQKEAELTQEKTRALHEDKDKD